VTRRQIAAPTVITPRLKLVCTLVSICFRVVGVAFDHQHRDTPDVDLGNHAEKAN
jgi:hypothetical protein